MHTYVQRWRSDDSDTMGEIEMNQKDFCGARRYGIWAVNYVYVCGVIDNREDHTILSSQYALTCSSVHSCGSGGHIVRFESSILKRKSQQHTHSSGKLAPGK